MGAKPDLSPSSAMPPLMSSADVIAFLGITKEMIWKLEQRGEFPPAIRMGRVKRWEQADILAYIRSRKVA